MTATSQLRWLFSGNPRVAFANRRRAPEAPVRLLPRPIARGPIAHSPRRLNAILRGLPGARRYLEIGIFEGATLQMVAAPTKVGVDPDPKVDLAHVPDGISIYRVTSDEYFEAFGAGATFDLAFLDGLHLFEQTYRDVINTLASIPSGPVLIDDTVPTSERSAMRDRPRAMKLAAADGEQLGSWHGDVWKTVIALSRLHPELDFRTIMGSGNPQTLVWRRAPGASVVAAPTELLEPIAALSYEEVLAHGVPDEFKPAGEIEAIETCLSAVGP